MNRTELNASVANLVCVSLDRPGIPFDLDLVKDGLLDRLSQLELAYELEDTFHIQIADSEIDSLRSIKSAVACVARKITVIEDRHERPVF